jgi:hypothetical protein
VIHRDFVLFGIQLLKIQGKRNEITRFFVQFHKNDQVSINIPSSTILKVSTFIPNTFKNLKPVCLRNSHPFSFISWLFLAVKILKANPLIHLLLKYTAG